MSSGDSHYVIYCVLVIHLNFLIMMSHFTSLVRCTIYDQALSFSIQFDLRNIIVDGLRLCIRMFHFDASHERRPPMLNTLTLDLFEAHNRILKSLVRSSFAASPRFLTIQKFSSIFNGQDLRSTCSI